MLVNIYSYVLKNICKYSWSIWLLNDHLSGCLKKNMCRQTQQEWRVRGSSHSTHAGDAHCGLQHLPGDRSFFCRLGATRDVLTPMKCLLVYIVTYHEPNSCPHLVGVGLRVGTVVNYYNHWNEYCRCGCERGYCSKVTAKHLVLPAPVGPHSSYELKTL